MEYQNILDKIEKAKLQLIALKKEENTHLHQLNWENKVRLEENYAANYLSGGTISKEEIGILIDEKTDYWVENVKKYDRKELYETVGHDKIMLNLLDGHYNECEISVELMQQLHKDLLFEPYDKEKRFLIGRWKNADNQLVNYRGEVIYFSNCEKVGREINEIIQDWQNFLVEKKENKTNIQVVEKIAQFHLAFLQIHPFYEGNGRIARLIMNIMLYSFGYPTLLIGENEKFEYERTLALAQAYKKMPQYFFGFVAERLLDSLQMQMRYLSGNYIADKRQEVQFRLQQLKQKLSQVSDKIENRKENINWQIEMIPFLQKMFAAFSDNIAQFSDLFFETKPKLSFFYMDSTQDWLHKEIFSPTDFDDLKSVLNMNDCTFSYAATQFRYNPNSPFSFSMDVLKIAFQEFSYQILCQKEEGMFVFRTYTYNKIPNEREISEIFAQVGEAILRKIEMSNG